jgi:two-component system response regulator
MPEREVEVLVVEDNPNDVEMTVYALEQHRLSNRIHVARDGAEALEFIFGPGPGAGAPLEGAPRLILLDLKLPKVDGIEVLRRLKGDPRTRAIPVVVLTSSGEERDLVESYHLGANSYVVKPVDFGQFTEAVRNVGFYWLLLNWRPGG